MNRIKQVLVVVVVAVVVVALLLAIDREFWDSGPTVLWVVLLVVGMSLASIGRDIGDDVVTGHGVVTAGFFVAIYAAAARGTSDDQGIKAIEEELLLGFVVGSTPLVLSGLVFLTAALLRNRRPPTEPDPALTQLVEQIDGLSRCIEALANQPGAVSSPPQPLRACVVAAVRRRLRR